jgi:hypothetical protein
MVGGTLIPLTLYAARFASVNKAAFLLLSVIFPE